MSDSIPQQKITYIGKVDYRDKKLTFGIKEKDRTKHTYIIGKSGMGKSVLLENLIIQDINNGEGVCVIDPHGSLAEKVLEHIPESRVKDVVYFAPFDGEFPMGLNMLEKVAADKRYLLANGMMSAFKKIFTDGEGKGTFSARMEYVLNNIILALLENDGQTLLGVNRMLFDKDYRKFIVSNVTDPTVKDFWVNEYASYTDKMAQELAPAIQNKIGQFVSNPLIRNIIGQKKTSFDVRKMMDEKKIFIVNLSKGKVGDGNANLLGSLLITKIYLAAMSRADVEPEEAEKLPPCYFYVDEFQNFANESFAGILSEARKYKLALTVAHQYIEQMTDEVKSAVFGNVGTMITFRVGATDAEVFEKEFAPYFILDDFVNLSAYQIYIRLMIDNQGSRPFSATTLPPITRPSRSFAKEVIAYSRTTYAKPKDLVEEEIMEFYKPAPKPEKKKEEVISSPESKSSKIAEAKEFTPSSQPRSVDAKERREKSDREKNITRYDVPPKRVESIKPAEQEVKKEEQKPTPFIAKTMPEEVKMAPHPARETHHMRSAEKQNTPNVVRTPERKPYVKESSPVHFDEKPPLSLKDALAKALQEHGDSSSKQNEDSTKKEVREKEKEEKVSESSNTQKKDKGDIKTASGGKTEEKSQSHGALSEEGKKEVAEEVLRKLIEE